MQSYLLGFVWGVEHKVNGQVVMFKERTTVNDSVGRVKVFGTLEETIQVMQHHMRENCLKIDWKYFYKGYSYQTTIPANAKGLRPWIDKMGERVYLEQFVPETPTEEKKKYLFGYIWGTERIADGYTVMNVSHTHMTHPDSPIVYRTVEDVSKAIREYIAKNPPELSKFWKYFYEGNMYETANPEHSKGLLPWENSMSQRVYIQ